MLSLFSDEEQIPKFNPMYKRAKTGKIQSYAVEIVKQDKGYKIYRVSGQIDGKLRTEETFITEGKQKRTPLEQAILEARQFVSLKKDQGYKTTREIVESKNWNMSTVEHGDLPGWLDRNMPKFNTDANGAEKCMLAQSIDKQKKPIKYPAYVQPKLDGARCFCFIEHDAEGGTEVKFVSRTGKQWFTLGHLNSILFEYFKGGPSVSVLLDGEIYVHGWSFQRIISAAKAKNEDTHLLEYHVYDMPSEDIQDQRLVNMFSLLGNINRTIPGSDRLIAVETEVANNRDEVDAAYAKYIAKGYEGGILRIHDGIYEFGQRSKNLLKIKGFDETEFRFKRFVTGKRGIQDLVAVCETETGTEFEATMNGTYNDKVGMYGDEHKLIDSMLTVTHLGFTDDGIPRHANGKAFRDYE